MVTAQGVRFTEWTAMAYDNATGAFEPRWGGVGNQRGNAFPFPPPPRQPQPGAVLGPFKSYPPPQCPAHSVFELYNHSADPAETRNLAQQPWSTELEELIVTLRAQLHTGWRAAIL